MVETEAVRYRRIGTHIPAHDSNGDEDAKVVDATGEAQNQSPFSIFTLNFMLSLKLLIYLYIYLFLPLEPLSWIPSRWPRHASRLHPLPHIWFDWGRIKRSLTTPLDPNQEPKRYTCAREVDKLPGPDAANWTTGHGYRSWILFLLSNIYLSTFQYVYVYLDCALASNGCC
jgi:hypothetical protein